MNRRRQSKFRLLAGTVLPTATALTLVFAAAPGHAQTAAPAPQDTVAADRPAELGEIVVTGVMSGTARDRAAAAISAISEADIARQAPASAADLLKDVPGVYVNSSVGEARNVVYARGISVGTFQSTTGFYWVSLMEDGLPVTVPLFSNFGPDMFYRSDITTRRVEAVRGGSAVVTGPNAPGGLFNYISRTGESDPGAEFRAKVGVEGDGGMSYRGDFWLGHVFEGSGFSASVGGFYRTAEGARPAGYPFNEGGQIKANVGYDYGSGDILVYGKLLDDVNGSYDSEYLPTMGYEDLRLRPGVERTDSYLPPNETHAFPINEGASTGYWSPKDLGRYTAETIGVKWFHDFGNDWTLNLNAKLGHNRSRQKIPNTAIRTFGLTNRDLYGNLGLAAAGLTAPAGSTVYLRDRKTGDLRAEIRSTAGAVWDVVSNNLPGAVLGGDPLFDNSILYGTSMDQDYQVDDRILLATLTRKTDTLTLNAGFYFADSDVDKYGVSAGTYVMPIEDRPSPLDVTLQTADGTLYQVTNLQGFGALGQPGDTLRDVANQREIALFGGLTWTPNEAWTFDVGVRNELFEFDGSNVRTANNLRAADRTFGGIDGDPSTIYDNVYARYLDPISFDKSVRFTNYSAAVSYRFLDNQSVYVRYSRGLKNPDNFYNQYDNPIRVQTVNPVPPIIEGWELGYAYRGPNFNFIATPFYTNLDKVSSVAQGTDELGQRYYTDPALSQFESYGVEFEGSYDFTDALSLRVAATFQDGKAISSQTWRTNNNGRDDDVLEITSGELENLSKVMGNATLAYDNGRFRAYASTRYVGERPVAVASAYNFAAYSQTDLGIGYRFTEKLEISGNINNVFDDFGVLGVSGSSIQFGRTPPPTTQEIVEMYPDANNQALIIQPRSFWLTLNYAF